MPTSARAVQTVFTEIFGEFVTSRRADVGIGPYTQTGSRIRIRRNLPKTGLRRAVWLCAGERHPSAPPYVAF